MSRSLQEVFSLPPPNKAEKYYWSDPLAHALAEKSIPVFYIFVHTHVWHISLFYFLFYFTCLLETNLGFCTFSYVFFLKEKKLQAIWMTWSISLVDCGIWADSQRKFLLEIRFLPSPRACHVLEEREIEKGKEGKYDSGRQRNSCVQRPKQKIICWRLTTIESHFNLNTYNFGECTSFKEENCVTFFYYKKLQISQDWNKT